MFKSALARAIDRVYARAGDAATHTDRDGVHTPCTVMVERDLTRYGDAAKVNLHTAAISVRVSQMPAAPRRSDRFTITDTMQVFTVDALQGSDGIEHKVFVA